MKIDEIKKLALKYLKENAIESDFLEYKKSHLQQDSILKTMCAFANNLMNRHLNMILIGVEEHDEANLKATPIRPIYGYSESQIETAENSIKSLTSYIKPKINFSITHSNIDGKSFVIVAFSNNNVGPYEITEKAEKDKNINLKRGRYVRIERDSRLASLKEEFELLKKFANYHFSEELSTVATIDDLDVDYIREFLNMTTNRNNTNILSKYEMAQNMNLIDTSTNMVRNFAVLMFSRNPEKFIPYSYIELIHTSKLGESVMSSKEYRGPIWKQVKNIMDDIKNMYLNSITLRINDRLESETIYNYPYSAVEELLTNAIVHKNYENPRTVQVYIYEKSIVITNYNRPIPPVTINDLNTKDAFPNRVYENPTIREMFKALDYIESYGSGIGKAYRAMAKNGNEKFHYEEYDENIDITSVVIPVNERYYKYTNLDIENEKFGHSDENLDIENKKFGHSDENLDIEGQNLDIGNENLDIQNQNLDIGNENLDIGNENLDIQNQNLGNKNQNLDIGDEKFGHSDENLDISHVKIKINTIDILGIIKESTYSGKIKEILIKIYNQFFNETFGRGDIVDFLKSSNSAGSNYVNYLLDLGILETVYGKGKGKYKFK